jgi:ubiquinone/menaquinone biosynthesis C-methylase UbiE
MIDGITSNGLSIKAHTTATRYLGDKAMHYEAHRMNKNKWMGEDRKVKEFLNDFPKGTSILDIPCGTGRFFPFYHEKGFEVLGIDISPDMLAQAKQRVGSAITVKLGNIFNIGLVDAFDIVLCIRFLNLIEFGDIKYVLAEMQRAAKSRIILTLRVRQKNPTGHYHSAYAVSLIKDALLPGWKIGRNEAMYEEDYRLIEISK